MKYALLLVLAVLGLSGSVWAQRADRHAELPSGAMLDRARVEELTRQMCNTLHLNEAQYIRLRAANLIKYARQEEISWQFKDDMAAQRTHLTELEAQYEAECSRILTPSQLSTLQAEKQRDAMPTKPDPAEGSIG